MFLDGELSAAQVLSAFHQDAPYLFLGAAFVAVGLVSVAFSAIRRKHDSLLIYFALFAIFYGLRLWVQASLLGITLPISPFYVRLRSAIDYLVLIPGFLYFNVMGLPNQRDRMVGYGVGTVGAVLAAATFIFGPSGFLHLINNIVVIAALIFLVVRFLGNSPADHDAKADFLVIRWGLLIFVTLALGDNVATVLFGSSKTLEPFGFAVFLSALGYVAARRTLQRDQQLSEIQRELEVARRIQLSILPASFPPLPHFQVAARCVPMTSVAGDFYDYIVADHQQAGILIADVSGHGVPAALIASMVKLAAAAQRSIADDPSAVLAGMNSALLGNTQDQFVTAAYLHLNWESKELRYSAAAHPPMLLLRNGQVRVVEANGLMLAAFDFATYLNTSLRLEAGDRLLLYTDGILEAANTAGDFFGPDALSELFRDSGKFSVGETADLILSSVRKWAATQEDDLTVLVCEYNGDGQISSSRA
jgi:phosphoserine phosphatase RsbU/P